MRRAMTIAYEAARQFNDDDGWAIASHIALWALMAMFPFLLVVTALAGIFGSEPLAEQAADLLLQTWPTEVAAPLARQIHIVLVGAQGDVLSLGAALALIFASSGVEGLRVGLNRFYAATERRSWWLLRLESIGYVLVGAVALLAFAFLLVLGPLMWSNLLALAPWLAAADWLTAAARLTIAAVVLIVALLIVHMWLPAGRRSLGEVAPGVLVTILLWLIGGIVFGRYLADFAVNYTVYYAGLASVMIALVFLYWIATIFVYGGALNAVIKQEREKKRASEGAVNS